MWKPPAFGPLVRVLRGDFGLALGVRQGEDHRTLGDLALRNHGKDPQMSKKGAETMCIVCTYIHTQIYDHISYM